MPTSRSVYLLQAKYHFLDASWVSTATKELSKSFYVGRHRPVSDRLNLFRIGPEAVLTDDASKKWYFASSKYALLEIGIQLMLTHQCKNVLDVESVDFQIRLSIHSPAMD